MSQEYISIIALAVASLALSYSILVKYLHRRSAAVIASAFAVLTYVYLDQNPDVLQDTVQRIVWAILAGLVSLALMIRDKK